jgi:1,4-dihydroxy-2-naphthoate octaprenyltransferase
MSACRIRRKLRVDAGPFGGRAVSGPGQPIEPRVALGPGARSRLGLWVQATRPPSLLTSIVPAAAGGLVAIHSAHPRWWLLGVALLALLLIHAGTNASNDVEDNHRGVDAPDKLRPNSQVFTTGLMTTREGRILYGGCFAGGIALGALICIVQGPALIVIGVIGVFGGLLYTAGPWPYKYAGLGEPFIILLMGPLMTQGTYTAVTGDGFSAAAFWVGIGPGLLIACVLASNNIDDHDSDKAAGARTLAVRIGFDRARVLYAVLMLLIIPAQIALWATGLFDAWILLPLALVPLLVSRAREPLAVHDPQDPFLATFTPRTGQVHLLFSLLLCAGVVLARI